MTEAARPVVRITCWEKVKSTSQSGKVTQNKDNLKSSPLTSELSKTLHGKLQCVARSTRPLKGLISRDLRGHEMNCELPSQLP